MRPAHQAGLLPSLASIRAFEAAARLGSFARAADELGLTASAVSHQVKALEAFMRCKLFVRERQRVQLSADGMQFLPGLRPALDALSAGVARVRHGHRSLRVTVVPSLAHRWLLGRLPDFVNNNASVDLRLSVSQSLADLTRDGFELGVRFGSGRWEGVVAVRLAAEWMVPVVAAPVAARYGLGRELLTRVPLLRDDRHDWAEALRQLRVPADKVRYGPQFNDSAQVAAAAEAGQGVALARYWLVRDALRSEKLLRVPGVTIDAAGAYFLVSPSSIDSYSAEVRSFSAWISDRFAEEVASASV